MVCSVEIITWQLIIRSVFTAEVKEIWIIPNVRTVLHLNSIVWSIWLVFTVLYITYIHDLKLRFCENSDL